MPPAKRSILAPNAIILANRGKTTPIDANCVRSSNRRVYGAYEI